MSGCANRREMLFTRSNNGVDIPVFQCADGGKCVLTEEHKKDCWVTDARVCQHVSSPAANENRKSNAKNLIYHIYPKQGSLWRWNVSQLLRRISQFDGVITIGIVVDSMTDTADEVQAMFAGHRVDNWIIGANDGNIGEGVSFWEMLRTLPRDEGITFYAHAKGVKYHRDSSEFEQVRRWAEMMYVALLDDPSRVGKAMEGKQAVGCFRQLFDTPVKNPHPSNWIYSGTFFWFRNSALNREAAFSPIKSYWGVEYWPGQVFSVEETACLIGENCGPLYAKSEIDRWEKDFKAMQNSKGNFCYFTGTNRQDESGLIRAMIRSARAVGVNEDFHVFSPFPFREYGAIPHDFPANRSWKSHMAKIEILAELANLDYEYFVWLDSDNFFARHPGDLKELIRDNPIWVSMEADIFYSVHNDWYGMRLDERVDKHTPRTGPFIEIMRQFNIVRDKIWLTNGGMWIVRKEAIPVFVEYMFACWNHLVSMGFNSMPDEPPLAIVGQTMVPDPENNTFENHSHLWACDWHGHHEHKLPDGKPWRYKDWTTDKYTNLISPAIVHNMRGKKFMAASASPMPVSATPVLEPVGTMLSNILSECGITRPEGCSCRRWTAQMDLWGVSGCQKNRKLITDHLRDEAKKSTWMDLAAVAFKGYLTIDSLLDEAIRRATPKPVPKSKPVCHDIPIYINSRNLLTPLKRMVEYLREIPNSRVIIVDNASTWGPLLEWYRECGVEVLMTGVNGGHLAWHRHMLNHAELGISKYVVTDSDLLIDHIPIDILARLGAELDENPGVTKSGLSIETDGIANGPLKPDIESWESQFWQSRHNENFWKAAIDTTFSMRRASDPVDLLPYGNHLRSDRPYTAIHWPWTWDAGSLTDEQRHYIQTSATQTMWTEKLKAFV